MKDFAHLFIHSFLNSTCFVPLQDNTSLAKEKCEFWAFWEETLNRIQCVSVCMQIRNLKAFHIFIGPKVYCNGICILEVQVILKTAFTYEVFLTTLEIETMLDMN